LNPIAVERQAVSQSKETAMDPEALLAHRDFVRSLARQLVRDDRADDVAQETWLAALERRPAADRSLRPWLAAVARNLARFVARGERRRAAHERAAARREAQPSAAEIVEREMARRRVVDAVLSLEEPYRSAILFRWFDDLPPREIARRTDVPVETVKTRLKRGLEQLRARLDREHGERAEWVIALLPLARAARSTSIAAAIGGGLSMKIVAKGVVVAAILVAVWLSAREVFAPRRAVEGPPTSSASSLRAAAAPSLESAPPAPIRTATAEATPGGSRVTGRVVDRGGRPIAGAHVVGYADDLAEVVRPRALAADGRTRGVETDAAGRFEIRLSDAGALVTLVAEAARFSPGSLESVRDGDDVEIPLDPPRAMAGIVLDAEGRPVAGARVGWLGMLAGSRLERETTSDAEGRYRLEELPSARAMESRWPFASWDLVEAHADGFAPLVVMNEARPEANGVLTQNLVLVRGATVNGRVLDAETGRPLVGARIESQASQGDVGDLRPSGVWQSHVLGERSLGEATTDAAGRFVLAHVPANGFHLGPRDTRGVTGRPIVGALCATAPGFAPGFADVLFVPDGTTLDVEICCAPAGFVHGRVVDAGGAPLAGQLVCVRTPDGRDTSATDWCHASPPPVARTDGEGRYELGSIAGGRGEPLATTVVSAYPGCWTESTIEIGVRAGETTDAPDLVAAADPSVVVSVTEREGRPIPRATVTAGGGGMMRYTDIGGRVRLFFRADDSGPARLVVSAHGFATTMASSFAPAIESPPEVRVVLERERRIAGIVRLDDGSPAPGAEVLVQSSAMPFAAESDSPRPVEFTFTRASTDEDGTFVARGLPEGSFDLHVSRETRSRRGGPTETAEAVVGDIPAGAASVEVTLRSPRPAGRIGVLEGTVVDARTGKPVPHVWVHLAGDSEPYAAFADVLPGRFRFEEAPAGTWTLVAGAEGYPNFVQRDVVVDPDAPAAPLRVRLDRGTRVHGRVRGPADLALGDATLAFVRGSREWGRETPLSSDGSFDVTGFEPGRWLPVVAVGEPMQEELRFVPRRPIALDVDGTSRDVEWDLEVVRAGGIVVSVSCPRLSPAGGGSDEQASAAAASHVSVTDATGALVDEWTGVLNGVGRRVTVAPGEYVVRIEVAGADPIEKRASVEAGASASVRVEVP
jgi:RNA polymerase sigma factor (sigma-70 family)